VRDAELARAWRSAHILAGRLSSFAACFRPMCISQSQSTLGCCQGTDLRKHSQPCEWSFMPHYFHSPICSLGFGCTDISRWEQVWQRHMAAQQMSGLIEPNAGLKQDMFTTIIRIISDHQHIVIDLTVSIYHRCTVCKMHTRIEANRRHALIRKPSPC